MKDNTRSYRLARVYFRLFEVLCYIGLVAVLAILAYGATKLGDPYARVQGAFEVVSSITGAFVLFFLIVMTQVGRAIVDTAEAMRDGLRARQDS